METIKQFFKKLSARKRKPVHLVAAPQLVTIRTDGNIDLTPTRARRMAEELRAFATIAERMFGTSEEA